VGEKALLNRIVSDPKIMVGKPVVKGTRISVDFLLSLFGQGWTEKEVLENYPRLTKADLNAVFRYAALILGEEQVLPFSQKARTK